MNFHFVFFLYFVLISYKQPPLKTVELLPDNVTCKWKGMVLSTENLCKLLLLLLKDGLKRVIVEKKLHTE